MSNVEMAQEGLEHAHHHGGGGDPWVKRAAMLVAAVASAAVIAEMSANDTQVSYLAAHINASDTWAQYQAKSVRRTVLLQSAEAIEAAHGDPAKAEAARRSAERMQSEPGKDGMEQLAERAHEYEHHRDHELHMHEKYERGVRGLQIAIVLVSLFVVTRVRWLLYGGAGLGALAGAYALLAALGLA